MSCAPPTAATCRRSARAPTSMCRCAWGTGGRTGAATRSPPIRAGAMPTRSRCCARTRAPAAPRRCTATSGSACGSTAACPATTSRCTTTTRPAVLIAGGIGITPIRSMALALAAAGRPFELHYAGRSAREMAYREELQRQLGPALHLYCSDAGQRLDLPALIAQAPPDAVFYVLRSGASDRRRADRCGRRGRRRGALALRTLRPRAARDG